MVWIAAIFTKFAIYNNNSQPGIKIATDGKSRNKRKELETLAPQPGDREIAVVGLGRVLRIHVYTLCAHLQWCDRLHAHHRSPAQPHRQVCLDPVHGRRQGDGQVLPQQGQPQL